MNHKRHRPKHQRAGCLCGGKAAKVYGTRNRKLSAPRDTNDAHARDRRLAITAQEQGT